MAIQARCSLENTSSHSFSCILIRRLLLRAYPELEVLRTIHVHAQEHLRVLCPAILRALTKKQSGLVRIEPGFVHPIRNQVGLSGKLWYPETVIRIGGK